MPKSAMATYHRAVYARLQTSVTTADGVYDRWTKNTVYPYVVCAEGSESNRNTKAKTITDNLITAHVFAKDIDDMIAIVNEIAEAFDTALTLDAGFTEIECIPDERRYFVEAVGAEGIHHCEFDIKAVIEQS